MTDITIKSGTDKLVSGIVNKALQKQTTAMSKAVEAGKKAGWQFASACHAVKLLYTGKVASDITAQFPTIKEYAAYVGIDAATIHNNARAYQFMQDHSQVPQITKKGAKTPTVNYDGFPLNVGQALILDSFTEEQLSAIKALAEKTGITLADISVAKMKIFKKCGKLEEPKAKATKEEPKAEATKEELKADMPKMLDPKKITAEQKLAIIDSIIDTMVEYGITVKDLTAREQQREKRA